MLLRADINKESDDDLFHASEVLYLNPLEILKIGWTDQLNIASK